MPARQERSASDTRPFVTRRVSKRLVKDRSYTGPSVWKSMHPKVRYSGSLFQTALKRECAETISNPPVSFAIIFIPI